MGAGELYNRAAASGDPVDCFIMLFKHSWRKSVDRDCQQVTDQSFAAEKISMPEFATETSSKKILVGRAAY